METQGVFLALQFVTGRVVKIRMEDGNCRNFLHPGKFVHFEVLNPNMEVDGSDELSFSKKE